MQDHYRKSIIQTLAYFELFDMPLSAFELYRHLYWPHRDEVSIKDLKHVLKLLVNKGEVHEHQDYFFLNADIKEKLALRKVRQKRAIAWMNRAKPWLRILAAWPGVEMIAICNNLAFLMAKEDSDIDLFIVTKPGRIWQTRFFLAAFLQVFKKRTTPKSSDAEKFCLSFFATSEALDLEKIQLEQEDIYFAYWIANLMPIYNPVKKYSQVLLKNHHLVNHVTRKKPENINSVWEIDDKSVKFRLLELFTTQTSWFPNWLEKKTKAWQEKHFSTEIQEALKQNKSHVIADDNMLKFHTNDRRELFLTRWKNKCDKVL